MINIFEYNRIVIVGNNGSGKSFLAKEIAAFTDLPLVHLDKEFWLPNWEQPSRDKWKSIQKELVSKKKWIIDGNHDSTMEIRFEAAELIIFLNINRLVCLYSVFKRYGKKSSDMPEYLEERFDKNFLRFCKGLWTFSKKRKGTIISLHKKYSQKEFFTINYRRAMHKLIKQWKSEKERQTNEYRKHKI